ncbi:hypothetical protein PO909_033504 [Leuciscus waleckii]
MVGIISSQTNTWIPDQAPWWTLFQQVSYVNNYTRMHKVIAVAAQIFYRGSPPRQQEELGSECSVSFPIQRTWVTYRLEVVGITSTHGLGSGTTLLERGWTLYHSGVANSERRRAGVGLLIAPQLSHRVLQFTPVNMRVASLRLRLGDRSLTVVCAYGPNGSVEFPAILESLGGVLESALAEDSVVLLGDFNTHMDSDSETWRGVIGSITDQTVRQ